MRKWIGALALVAAASTGTAPAWGQAAGDKPQLETATVAVIGIAGGMSEGAQSEGLFGDVQTTLKSVLDRLEKARTDKKVHALALKVGGGLGRGQINEIRQAVQRFRKSGKKAYALMEEGSSAEYLLATAADEIVLPPPGVVMLTGVRMEFSYYKDLFDKLGVHVDTLAMGDFKGAGEPFSRSSMSEPQKAQMTLLLDDIYEQMLAEIAVARKKTPDEVRKLIDQGPFTAEEALKLGLVDRLEYLHDFKERVAKELGAKEVAFKTGYGKKKTDLEALSNPFTMFATILGNAGKKSHEGKTRIALLHAEGGISTGRSGGGGLFGGGGGIGSDTMVEAIRKIAKDADIKAVVMRVDSPGGSALASDLILEELKKVGKPVVVSMGDVAASGGYYISMGADRIFAEPGTITGSIGVISIKPALEGLYRKVGINTEVLSRGQNSGIMGDRPWTDGERAAWLKVSSEIYRQFTTKAAAGRKLDHEMLVKDLAGGRVWTGRQAKKHGLIDELGTLEDALNHAKGLAKLDGKIDVESFPKASNPFDALLGLDHDGPSDARALLGAFVPAELRDAVRPALALVRLAEKERTLLALPFSLKIK